MIKRAFALVMLMSGMAHAFLGVSYLGNGQTISSGTITNFTSSVVTESTVAVTGPLKVGTSFGTSGQALFSAGATAAPTWGNTGQAFNFQKFSISTSSSTGATNFARSGLAVTITPKVITDSLLRRCCQSLKDH